MTIKYSGKILEDFENYLESTGLWKRWEDNTTQWIYKLGERVEDAAKRTAADNLNLQEKDLIWFVELVKLQQYYGESVDLFGEYLEAKGLTSQKNGQFFTPASVCELISNLIGHEEPSYPMTISDPASGTGRLMIQDYVGRKSRHEEKFNPVNYIYYNMDIDYKAFLFSLLNAVLRNLRSVNAHGDTLSMQIWKTFSTQPTTVGVALWFDENFEAQKRQVIIEKAG